MDQGQSLLSFTIKTQINHNRFLLLHLDFYLKSIKISQSLCLIALKRFRTVLQ